VTPGPITLASVPPVVGVPLITIGPQH